MSLIGEAMAALQPGGDHKSENHRSPTSDLSIDETLLLQSIGWEVVDLVFGISWWSIPWGTWQWQTGEVGPAGAAFMGALGEATEGMREECAKAGGTGVVGVRVDVQVRSFHVAISLTGTAVRKSGAKAGGFEFLSDLSARDFVLLNNAGWVPISLAMGAGFVIAPRRSAKQWASQQGQNTELPNLTQALYQARETAMERMQRAGLEAHADGIVNVRLREGPLGHSPRIMQFLAVGTAVRLGEQGHQSIKPSMVVPLDDQVRLFQAASIRGSS